MPKLLRFEPQHTTEELSRLYRQAHDRVVRSHWHILWLISQGKRTADVAAGVGYSVPWVRAVVHRYNARGTRQQTAKYD